MPGRDDPRSNAQDMDDRAVTGPAEDPYEDRPDDRREALQPLLGDGGTVLTAASLRFLRGSGEERLDLILSLPDPEASIQAMAAEEYVLLVREIGLEDAGELLSLASPRQLQTCTDLDVWKLGELDAHALGQWIEAALEADREVAERFVAAQEDGLLSLYLGKSLRAYSTAEEDLESIIPQDLEVFLSPDGSLTLAADPDDPELGTLRSLIDLLYAESVERGRRVLMALQWELPSQLEDQIHTERSARVEELGFLPRDEAREMFAYRDPHAWRRELRATYSGTGDVLADTLRPYLPEAEPTRIGLALKNAPTGSFLARAVAAAPERDRDRLRLALVRLCYRLQSARAVTPSAVEELGTWSHQATTTASMGLEFLSDGDIGYAALLLQVLPLVELFRAGHSLVLIEHGRARRLRSALGGDAALDLLHQDDMRLVRGLCRAFPALVHGDEEKPVEALAELADVRRRLQGLGALTVLARLGGGSLGAAQAKASNHQSSSLSALLNTAVAHHLLRQPPSFDPLSTTELRQFIDIAFVGQGAARKVRPELHRAMEASLWAQPDLGDDEVAALQDYVATALAQLSEELGGLDPSQAIDPRWVGVSLRVAG